MLKPEYFRYLPSDPSRPLDFVGDFWRIHWFAYATVIRLHHPEAIHFIHPPVFAVPPKIPESFLKGRACVTPHYYDGLTLMTRHWNWFNADALGLLRHKYWTMLGAIRIGEAAIRKSLQDQLGILQQDTSDVYGAYPTLIGEIGCPFDMDDKKAYGYQDGGKGKGDYSAQQRAWDGSMNALDGKNCLNYTSWTYVPDNSHEWGDLWNGEDLSIWSADDARIARAARRARSILESSMSTSAPILTSPSSSELKKGTETTTSVTTASTSSITDSTTTLAAPSSEGTATSPSLANILSGKGVTPELILDGARAVAAIVRPYPVATVGTPVRIDFDIKSTVFKYSVKVSSVDVVPEGVATEIYLPFVHYATSLEFGTPSSTPMPETGDEELPSVASSTNLISSRSRSPAPTSEGLTLNVYVKTTHGSYITKGQTLYWSYPIPETGEAIYTIEIQRNGGQIVRPDQASFSSLDADEEGRGARGWGDVCPAPSSCVIS